MSSSPLMLSKDPIATDESAANLPLTIIEPQIGWLSLNLPELWRYRDLLRIMVWRDISARYRQSVLGVGWAVFRPLISALIYTLVFSVFVRVKTEAPYPIFAFSALIPWMYFSGALMSVTASVVNSSGVLSKVYFPRLILPLAAVVSGLIEVLIQLVILGLMMAWYQYVPSTAILLLPVFVFIAVVSALAFGLWLTAMNVRYRDVGMAVPFFIQIGMYLCPILYPLSVVPERFQTLYALNPMVGVIEGFRWCVLGGNAPAILPMGISFAVMLMLLVGGLFYFRRTEASFADMI
jgi:lipopolysaccharide transport system permease protein